MAYVYRRPWFPRPKKRYFIIPSLGINLTGLSDTAHVGTLTTKVTLDNIKLTGLSAGTAVGSPTVGLPNDIALHGLAVVSESPLNLFPNNKYLIGESITSDLGTLVANPVAVINLTGLHVTAGYNLFTSTPVVVPDTRVFIIAGINATTTDSGIIMLPTSDNITLGSTPYIIGSSQYYTIGAVYWEGIERVQGTDWEFVTPGNHPTYTHIIQILNLPSSGTVITLIYKAWNIQVSNNFEVTTYPVTFSFYNTTIIADTLPQPGLYFTVDYIAPYSGTNPQSLLARYPIIYDDILVSHTSFDPPNGFTTYRPVGYQVLDTTDYHLYVWSSDNTWIDNGQLTDSTQFYVKNTRTIYTYYGLSVTSNYVVGSGDSAIPQVLTYPPFGEGVAYNLLYDGTQPNAPVNFPAAYEILQNPGDYNSWDGI